MLKSNKLTMLKKMKFRKLEIKCQDDPKLYFEMFRAKQISACAIGEIKTDHFKHFVTKMSQEAK